MKHADGRLAHTIARLLVAPTVEYLLGRRDIETLVPVLNAASIPAFLRVRPTPKDGAIEVRYCVAQRAGRGGAMEVAAAVSVGDRVYGVALSARLDRGRPAIYGVAAPGLLEVVSDDGSA